MVVGMKIPHMLVGMKIPLVLLFDRNVLSITQFFEMQQAWTIKVLMDNELV